MEIDAKTKKIEERNPDLAWLGQRFWDKDSKELGGGVIQGYKVIMLVHVAKW